MKRLASFCLDQWCLWILWSWHLVEHKASAFAIPHVGKKPGGICLSLPCLVECLSLPERFKDHKLCSLLSLNYL